ncbi:lipopolysaccharide assembly protein LapB [Marinobacter halodurans]|uniref:Lipopolysaccharide assembly protein B n=1 Tax=Marinobacter halodurans TaxID=2528979 RepID=A0ABY1ZKS7_9GAMM|nr:lipopolysaccharide assembly protein LapB [Marinobacter halodurans]TBW54610.1 lipopolysaccharide assembly protein LapB [Marinobacter halodurans]
METVLHWLLLVVAVAAGWFMGRWGRHDGGRHPRIDDEETVRDRLQFLFTNYSDEAIENFVQSLAVNRETVSLHLSVGAHFRLKGETERAIVIHQNLLARPELPTRYSPQVTYELAMDYMTAGLLDRAESLFHQLLGSRDYSRQAADQLIELYQQEREWDKARQVASTLTVGYPEEELKKQLAYLTCELAEDALRQDDRWGAQKLVKNALEQDRTCVRASFLQADIHRRQGNLSEVSQSLFRVFDQNPSFGPEAIDRLMKLAREKGDVARLGRRLRKLYESWPSTSLLLALVESVERSNGRLAAIDLLREELEIRPSLKGLLRLVEMAGYEKGMTTDEGRLVSRMGQMLLSNRPIYRCISCGFEGRQLHWLCPSCKRWEKVQPIQGVEAE